MTNIGQWFRGIRGKLMLLLALPLLALVVVGVVSIRGLISQSNELKIITAERIPIQKYNGYMRIAFHSTNRFLWEALSEESDISARSKAIEAIEKRRHEFAESYTAYTKLPLNDRNRQLISPIATAW